MITMTFKMFGITGKWNNSKIFFYKLPFFYCFYLNKKEPMNKFIGSFIFDFKDELPIFEWL